MDGQGRRTVRYAAVPVRRSQPRPGLPVELVEALVSRQEDADEGVVRVVAAADVVIAAADDTAGGDGG